MTGVHLVLPDGVDDPSLSSGGNAYDRRVSDGLAAMGWRVREHHVPGGWPRPTAAERALLGETVAGIEDDATVLVDGLIASAVPDVLVPQADRLRLVVLVHMPLGEPVPDGRPAGDLGRVRERERAVLRVAAAVVTTGEWTRDRLLDRYALAAHRVHVAEPGVAAAPPASGTPSGGELLCVAALTPLKGHDVLFSALATMTDLSWRCVCAGSVARDPGHVGHLLRQLRESGIADRVRVTGALAGRDLDDRYAAADVLVLPSHSETYGMVVTEALARGLPVVTTSVGGLPRTLGHAAAGRPGLLVPPGDPAALAAALRRWLGDADLRSHLRHAARQRRSVLAGWPATVARLAAILTGVAAATECSGASA